MTTAFSFDRPAGLATMGINVLSELSLGAGDKRMDDPIPRTASPFDLNSLLAGQSPYPTTQSPCSRLHLSQLNFSPLNFSPVAAHPNKAIAHHRHSTRDSLDHTLLLNGSPYAASTPIAINTDNVSAMERVLEEKNPLNLLARGADLFAGLVTPAKAGKRHYEAGGMDERVVKNARWVACNGLMPSTLNEADDTRAACTPPRVIVHRTPVFGSGRRVAFGSFIDIPSLPECEAASPSPYSAVNWNRSSCGDPHLTPMTAALRQCLEVQAAGSSPHTTHPTAPRGPRRARSSTQLQFDVACPGGDVPSPLRRIASTPTMEMVDDQGNYRRLLPPRTCAVQARANPHRAGMDSSDEEEADSGDEVELELEAAEGLMEWTQATDSGRGSSRAPRSHHGPVGGCKDDEPAEDGDGDGGAVGGTVTDSAVTKEMLQKLYKYTLKQAARILGVGATQLKRICRVHGIGRWPKRKLESAMEVVKFHQQAGNTAAAKRAQEELDMMYDQPDMILTNAFNKLRQKKFKDSHKARKRSRGGKGKKRDSL